MRDVTEVQDLPAYRAGLKEGKVRAYIKNRLLRLAGFEAKRKYRVEHIGPKQWELVLDDSGDHTVHGRRTLSDVVPIIDLLNVDFEVGEKFTFQLDNGKIILAEPFSATIPTTQGDNLFVDGVRVTDEDGNDQGGYYFTEVCPGGGGLSTAAIMAGLKPTIAIEIDPEIATMYHDNVGNHVVIGDAKEFSPELVKRMVERETPSGRMRIGIAGLPCQPFSEARTDKEAKGAEDERNLFPWFLRVIDELGFQVVVIENVPGLVRRHKEYFKEHILRPLQERGFHVTTTPQGLAPILNATAYGGASDRERAWILCSKYGEIPLPVPTHGPGRKPYITAQDVLQDLLETDHPDTEPLPPSVLALCERPELGGDEFRSDVDCYISGNNFNKLGPQFRPLTRPAPTQLASQGHRDRIRWKGNLYRVLEKHALRLNGFPTWFKDTTMQMIGNAVPPLTMGLAVMQAVVNHLRTVDALGLSVAPPLLQATLF